MIDVVDPLQRLVLEERLRLERLHTYLPDGTVLRPVDAYAHLMTERTRPRPVPRKDLR